jgi:hypothetical protein
MSSVFHSFCTSAIDSGVSFAYIVSGYISYNFVIGAYSYWGPKAGQQIYNMTSADYMFGGITIVCGIVGTLAGGITLDKIGSTIPNAFKLLSGATFLGAIFCFGAFCFKSLYGFIPCFSVGEILVFATQVIPSLLFNIFILLQVLDLVASITYDGNRCMCIGCNNCFILQTHFYLNLLFIPLSK